MSSEEAARAAGSEADPIVAMHEAGHAVARYLTAGEMGYSPSEAIQRIEIAIADDMRPIGESADGTKAFLSQAATHGPLFSKEIGLAGQSVLKRVSDGTTVTGPVTGEMLNEIVSRARAEGADIDGWLRARALQAVFGPMAEAAGTEASFEEIWNGDQAHHDAVTFLTDCALAGLSDVGQIQAFLDTAIGRGRELMERPDVCQALVQLATHLSRNGTTEGPVVVRIIERAIQAA